MRIARRAGTPLVIDTQTKAMRKAASQGCMSEFMRTHPWCQAHGHGAKVVRGMAFGSSLCMRTSL